MSSLGRYKNHRIEAFGLETLVRGAERSRSDRTAFVESGPGASARALTYRELVRAIGAFSKLVVEGGLKPRDRALVLGLNRMQTGVAVMGLLAAGVEPILAPAHADIAATTKIARLVNARAAFAEMSYGALDCRAMMQESARAADLSWVGALAGAQPPHALRWFWRDFSIDALLRFDGAQACCAVDANAPRIGVARLEEEGALELHYYRQDDLLGKAIGLLGELGATAKTPIVSLISPASLGGLVGALVMGLLTGAPIYFVGPFESGSFLSLVKELERYCLLAPAAALPDLAADGVFSDQRLVGVGVSGEGEAPPNDQSFRVARLDHRD